MSLKAQDDLFLFFLLKVQNIKSNGYSTGVEKEIADHITNAYNVFLKEYRNNKNFIDIFTPSIYEKVSFCHVPYYTVTWF